MQLTRKELLEMSNAAFSALYNSLPEKKRDEIQMLLANLSDKDYVETEEEDE